MRRGKGILQVPVGRLRPHPANALIYGVAEDISVLVQSIRENGVKEPLAISASRVILSGHRRWRAAKALHLKTVPAVIVDHVASKEDEIEALLVYNQHRQKTHEQRTREALRWFDIESSKARARQRAGKRADLVANCPQGLPGKARDRAALLAGIGSGRTLDKARQTVLLIDDLVASGRSVEAQGLRAELNRSYDAGAKGVKRYASNRRRALRLLRLVGTGEAKDLSDAQVVAIRQDMRRMPRSLPTAGRTYEVYCGDMLDLVDQVRQHPLLGRNPCIVTDPPYTQYAYGDGRGDTVADAYRKLALFAAAVLRPGGSLLAVAGQHHLPTILRVLTDQPGLSYYWTLCCAQPGASRKQHRKLVNVQWKAVLWFVRGLPSDYQGKIISDLIKSQPLQSGTRKHPWQQSQALFSFVIGNLSKPGDTVMDPYMGTGTTGEVSLAMRRRFIGVEIQRDVYRQALERLASATRESP